MLEFIWHARGGQGAFTAARCLGAAAALSAGKEVLAFPTFGPERRGAPMRAFAKIADAPIGDRSAVTRAQFVIYLDETLMEEGWEGELAEGGLVLLNTRRAIDDPRIVAIDADGISAAVLGRPIPNTAFLGAIPALTDAVGIEDIREGIRATMPAKLHEKNLAIVDAAYEELAAREIAQVRAFVAGEEPADEVTRSLSEKDPLFNLAAEILVEGDSLTEGEERSANGRDF
ncbi:2-oxoacid:acceptor oxidoreductase family protein [uncultured Adlercreutzia sp.]|uniref:2-oxoacid:acceptor oxidoreductase family protein n=1 Tax=uncultured Adlercreutzia sp. TaxID=875803 RepID=UPI0026F3BE12|nr:2-oxoacid:acceptor oxidoreductase family protein [uncultured Adlercreutzia sp.]